MDQDGSTEEGNKTSSSVDPDSSKREPLSAKWTFTQQVEGVSEMDLMDQCSRMVQAFEPYLYVFQLERGEETGKLHWQGFVQAQKRFRFLERFKKKLGLNFAKVANGNEQHNLRYCNKDETFVGHRHTNIEKLLDPLEGRELYPFQRQVLDIVASNEIEDRPVYWFWNAEGCNGKTAVAKHVIMNHPRRAILLGGKASDMKNGVLNFIEKMGQPPKIVMLNLVRSLENFVSYQGIEEVKDGLFYSPKYEGGMVVMNPPILIIFANFEPDREKLSADRWRVYNV